MVNFMLSVLTIKIINNKQRGWEIVGGDGYVYGIECGDGLRGVYLSPNSSSCMY